MRRAITLVIVLTVLSFGLSLWTDLCQRNTACGYLEALSGLRGMLLDNRLDEAAAEQAYLYAVWQRDAKWLNCITSHHHTRAVNTAMLKLTTALEQRWRDESLRALDEVTDALEDIQTSDFATLENIL